MHQQSARQLQEAHTSLSVDAVLDAATHFFARGGVYRAFPEKRSASHLALRGQGGEEIVIAARPVDAGTAVSGGSYLFDQQVAHFLSTLPPVVTVPAVDVPAAALPAETAPSDGAVA